MYLSKFRFLNTDQEENFLNALAETNEASYYPFRVFKMGQIEEIDFDQITIFLWRKWHWQNYSLEYYS